MEFNVPATPKGKRVLANPLGADIGICDHDTRTQPPNEVWLPNARRGSPAHSTVGARPIRLALHYWVKTTWTHARHGENWVTTHARQH
eukprot:448741-Lingulodinium_polyedra.AAC.1